MSYVCDRRWLGEDECVTACAQAEAPAGHGNQWRPLFAAAYWARAITDEIRLPRVILFTNTCRVTTKLRSSLRERQEQFHEKTEPRIGSDGHSSCALWCWPKDEVASSSRPNNTNPPAATRSGSLTQLYHSVTKLYIS